MDSLFGKLKSAWKNYSSSKKTKVRSEKQGEHYVRFIVYGRFLNLSKSFSFIAQVSLYCLILKKYLDWVWPAPCFEPGQVREEAAIRDR